MMTSTLRLDTKTSGYRVRISADHFSLHLLTKQGTFVPCPVLLPFLISLNFEVEIFAT